MKLLLEVFRGKKIQKLVESLGTKEFLLEITIPELEKQWVDQGKIKKYQFDDVKDYLGDLGANYMAWFLARSITDKVIDFEDLDIWADRLKVFKNNNNNKEISIKDLGKVKTKEDIQKLEKDVAKVNLQRYGKDRNAESGGKKRGVNEEDFCIGTLETSRDTFKVYKIPKGSTSLYSLSRKLGAGARWCTASSTNNYFNNYILRGPLYILIGSDRTSKFQFFPGERGNGSEFKGITDNEVNRRKEWVKQFFDWLVEKGELDERVEAVLLSQSTTVNWEVGDRDNGDPEGAITHSLEELEEFNRNQQSKADFQSNSVKEEVGSVHFINDSLRTLLMQPGGFERLEKEWNLNDQSVANLDTAWNTLQDFGTGAYCCVLSDKLCWSLGRYGKPLNNLTGRSFTEDVEQFPAFSKEFLRFMRNSGNSDEDLGYLEQLFSGAYAQSKEKFFEEHPWQHIEGTKMDYIKVGNSSLSREEVETYRKIVQELLFGSKLTGIPYINFSNRYSVLVRIAPGVYAFTGNVRPATVENVSLRYDLGRWQFSEGCPESVRKRPLEFYSAVWEPIYREVLGFSEENLQFAEKATITKYGNKKIGILQRYALPLTLENSKNKEGISEALSKVAFFRVPNNRRDITKVLGIDSEAPSAGILILPANYIEMLQRGYVRSVIFVSTLNYRKTGKWAVFAMYKGNQSGFTRLSRTQWEGMPYLESIYGRGLTGGQAIWRAVSAYLGKFVVADELPYGYDFDYKEAFGIYRKKDEEKQQEPAQEAPQQPTRAAQNQPEPQQSTVASQQTGEYVSAADATPGTEYGAVRVQYSTGQFDLLKDAEVVTWENGIQRLNKPRSVVDMLEREKSNFNTKVLFDRSTGKVYFYFMNRDGIIVKRYTSTSKSLQVLDPRHMKQTNASHRQELTPKQRQQLGLDEAEKPGKPRHRESLLRDLVADTKTYIKGEPVVFRIEKLDAE